MRHLERNPSPEEKERQKVKAILAIRSTHSGDPMVSPGIEGELVCRQDEYYKIIFEGYDHAILAKADEFEFVPEEKIDGISHNNKQEGANL